MSTDNQPDVFSDDPVINAALSRLNIMAANYRELVAVVTGKFDQNFTQWRSAQSVGKVDETKLPALDTIETWAWETATPLELIALQQKLSVLTTEVNRALFGRYAGKNDRKNFDPNVDVGAARAKLIRTLDSTVELIEAGNYPVDGITTDMIYALPAVGDKKDRGDGKVWDFDNAPRKPGDESDVKTTANYRSNNTTVKFVIVTDGKPSIPDEDMKLNLGQLTKKYFDKTPQDVAPMFGNWSAEYFITAKGDDITLPTKMVERNEIRFALVKV